MTHEINIRSSHYYILEATINCWKCKKPTRVYAFALPAGHQVLELLGVDENEFESDEAYETWANDPASYEWRTSDVVGSLSYIERLPDAIEARIRALTAHFWHDHSKMADESYLMNHCECCGMKQGDFNLHCEPCAAFMPLYERDVARMVYHQINEPFEMNHKGGYGELELFELIRPAVAGGGGAR